MHLTALIPKQEDCLRAISLELVDGGVYHLAPCVKGTARIMLSSGPVLECLSMLVRMPFEFPASSLYWDLFPTSEYCKSDIFATIGWWMPCPKGIGKRKEPGGNYTGATLRHNQLRFGFHD